MTPPGPMTERWDITSGAGGAAADETNIEAADEFLAAAGPTGIRSATAAASDGSIGHLVALALRRPPLEGADAWQTSAKSTDRHR